MTDDQLIQIIFNEKHAYADVYWCFETMLGLGIKGLYEVTKDMFTLRKEMQRQMAEEESK